MSGMKLLSSPLPEVALIDMPSTVTRWSPVRLPWTESVLRLRLFVPP